ncbi:GNAT family N-acetyltransferase [Paenibacillus xylaniclasticus]|uniref:GNAT family N-acetyltransferase n=1 Tax=Paenibacillus xylaniclasticus TaxID=588083 RepID=UPI000FDB1D2D|nr:MULTISPECIES: GNAT family N-acetyltransferase [Paenibacillus]GFN31352.1 N-acetyltransferase [Paenibacillus curdlanolyticus]
MVIGLNSEQHEMGSIKLSLDRSLLDLPYAYRYLHDHMYWAKSLTFDAFQRAVTNSAVVVGAYDSAKNEQLVGFSRVVSDLATFAYLTDVFIVEQYRCRGLSRKMLEMIIHHPDLQGLRRFLLVTEDAHGLYAKFGFEPLHDGANWMQIYNG